MLRFLLHRYVFALPIFVIVAGIAFYWAVRRHHIDECEAKAITLALQMNTDILRELVGSDGGGLLLEFWNEEGRLLEIDRLIRQVVRYTNVTRVHVFSPGGRIVYSTMPDLIGVQSTHNAKLESALRGNPVSSLEAATDQADFPSAPHIEDLMETYVPIRALGPSGQPTGLIIGSFEIYQSTDEMERELRALRWMIFAGSCGILLALGLVLVTIGRKVSTVVQAERDEQERLDRELNHLVTNLEETVEKRTADVRRERETLLTILDEAPSAFVLLDGRANILYETRQFKRLARKIVPPPREPGMAGCTLCGPGRQECAARVALADGRVHSTLRATTFLDSDTRWLEHTAVPVHLGESGIRIIEMITDVTDSHKAREQLSRAARIALTGELAAAVAHEVRNAATTTKLLLQLWAEETRGDPKRSKSIDVALLSVARMEALVENLLRIGRQSVPSFAPCDLVAIFREAVKLVRPEIHRTRIKLIDELPAEPLPCKGDPGLLTQAFLNILLNAAQALADQPEDTPREIVIRAGFDSFPVDLNDDPGTFFAADELIREKQSGANLVPGAPVVFAEVEDSGPGIPGLTAKQLFEPFFTTKPGGTGLGLPITMRILKSHGGTMIVRTGDDHGLRVRLILPSIEAE